MPSPDPIHLLRQAIASHQGLTVAAPEVVICAHCLYKALPRLMRVLEETGNGYMSIYVKHGKYDRVEWHQVAFD